MKRRTLIAGGIAAAALPLTSALPVEAVEEGPVYAAGQSVGTYRRVGKMVYMSAQLMLKPGETAIIYGLPHIES